ncbi:hypothetical protein WELLINGTON_254 [Erwinia phage Wellington]|uniref:Uncharacterized protein n=1 Tax=Erwinia phage Wellington TaxID=2267653 RepID=A0A345BLQ9_9CAUD|nr:hypothetical protein HOT70_gp047 [Erwinia phage Wellington]AXF51380.1 hypothetical protein WELLINGTON_254 [Erwinia phage Wellington]
MKVEVHATKNGIEVVCPTSRKNVFVAIDSSWTSWYKELQSELNCAKTHHAVFMLPERTQLRVMVYIAKDRIPRVSTTLLANAVGMFLAEHGDENTRLTIIE